MRIFSLFAALFFFFLSLQAQDLIPVYSLPQSAQLMYLDKIGNFYTVEDYTLTKYDAAGEPVFVYNDNQNGKISHADFSNPLQPLLYYSFYSRAVLLDRTLNKQSLLDFSQITDGEYLACVSLASDNNVWIYNPNTFTIEKLDKFAQPIYKSADLGTLVDQNGFYPELIVEYENHLYLYEPNVGLLCFDLFANYQKTIPIRGVAALQFYQKQVFYTYANQLYVYNLDTEQGQTLNYKLPEKSILQFLIFQNYIWLRLDDSIDCFKID
jgi:hypothetical protein